MIDARANLAAAELADEIKRRFGDPEQQKRALDALALVVSISGDVMDEGSPHVRVTH